MYRDELMALNALVEEQRKTNDLLERLIEAQSNEQKQKRGAKHADSKGPDA
ncbi:YebO family protein [Paenibacillus filicis]|uniref:YebO family protein n=1 Tax=Paenibacillus filicis TaxID=669464 RepID=A0ABU9DJW5_9BACL